MALRVGGFTAVKVARTATGIKDTFLAFFLDKLFKISKKRGKSKEKKQSELAQAATHLPPLMRMMSPVWRIQDLDPHADTPVEILHVILLGFVKYFWRDAMARLKDDQKRILIARLTSIDISGLGISPLAGATLVNYAGSLTGCDFRAIAQVATFVLYDLLPQEAIDVWTALGTLVSLVWQPEIEDIEGYLKLLRETIDHFLICTCKLTPRWFNKPKFHILLHLPEHIRRFGPAMLFATEGFESFNAIIRSHSIHSNRHAPSLDIAISMARANRLCHLLSGRYFRKISVQSARDADAVRGNSVAESNQHKSPWLANSAAICYSRLTCIGPSPRQLLEVNDFLRKTIGLEDDDHQSLMRAGVCAKAGHHKWWSATKANKHNITNIQVVTLAVTRGSNEVYTLQKVSLVNGDWCAENDWVTWHETDPIQPGHQYHRVGRVLEILQMKGSDAYNLGQADFVLVRRSIIGESHAQYHMPMVKLLDEYTLLEVKDILCMVNVQHNCMDNKCLLAANKSVYQEREQTTQFVDRVAHKNGMEYILNLAKMRDSRLLAPFRHAVPVANHDEVIHHMVLREIEVVKERAKSGDAKGKAKVKQGLDINHLSAGSAQVPNHSRKPSTLRHSHMPGSFSMQEPSPTGESNDWSFVNLDYNHFE